MKAKGQDTARGSLRTTLLYGVLCNQAILRYTGPRLDDITGGFAFIKVSSKTPTQESRLSRSRDRSYRRPGRKSLRRCDE